MKELQKTFLAGLSVLIVLLLAPYYLQWIGYDTSEEIAQETLDVTNDAPVLEAISNQAIDEDGLFTYSMKGAKDPIANDADSISIYQNKVFTISNDVYAAQISSYGGGSFSSFSLNQYRGRWDFSGNYLDTNKVLLVSDKGLGSCAPCVSYNKEVFKENFNCTIDGVNSAISDIYLEEGVRDSVSLVCVLQTQDLLIEKKSTFYSGSFLINHIIWVNGVRVDGSSVQKNLGLFWDRGLNNTEKNLYDDVSYSGVSISENKEIKTSSLVPSNINDKMESFASSGGLVDWAAIRTKYFILAVLPAGKSGVFNGAVCQGSAQDIAGGSLAPLYSLAVSKNIEHNGENVSFNTYLGPLDIDYINALDTTLDRIMNFGWFIIQPFSRGILWLLKSLHSLGLNYGVILILFAFLVRIITGPLTKKSFESTQNMQAIQPKLKKIQDKYKSDPQKLNTEMVKLYRDNGVNPLGGCLPMLLQMPLLFSLFLVFRSTIEFRGASFVWWIKDLSLPDTIVNLPFTIPIYGDQVAFLPILLGISMFLTQKMSMANMDTGMGQQKYMMYFMSAFFFLIFNSFPSGLNLYYLIYNILNYLQQKSLKKA
jgi:YidC/Oxa1 family membrane protein insertase